MLNSPSPVDPVLRALADPTRRGIVELLSRGPATGKSIVERLPMTQQSMNYHAKVLEDAGVVRSEMVGRLRTFVLVPGHLAALGQWALAQEPAESAARPGASSAAA